MSVRPSPRQPVASLPLPARPPYTLTLTADALDPLAASAPLATALTAAGHMVGQRRFLDAPAGPDRQGTLLVTLAGTLDQLVSLLGEPALRLSLVRTVFPTAGTAWALLQLKASAVFACLPLATPPDLDHALADLHALEPALAVPRGGERATGGGEWVLQWTAGRWRVSGPPPAR